jgi:hypothetical protein
VAWTCVWVFVALLSGGTPLLEKRSFSVVGNEARARSSDGRRHVNTLRRCLGDGRKKQVGGWEQHGNLKRREVDRWE